MNCLRLGRIFIKYKPSGLISGNFKDIFSPTIVNSNYKFFNFFFTKNLKGKKSVLKNFKPALVRSSFFLGRLISFRNVTIGLALPYTLLTCSVNAYCQKHKKESEIFMNIPNKVYQNDVLIKPNLNYNLLVRLFLFSWNLFRIFLRVCHVFVVFTPLILSSPVLKLNNERLSWIWWRMLLFSIENTGTTFIKLGQWASTRRDLFPSYACDMFSRLHNHTKVHSWFATKRKLKKAFGKQWNKIFVKIDKKPIGSGCIAQVHLAYMSSDMILDETIIQDVDESQDQFLHEIDFGEGMEILGFGNVIDSQEMISDFIKDASSQINHQISKSMIKVNEEFSKGNNDSCEDELTIIPVAVKVLHPGIYRSVNRDLIIIKFLGNILEKMFPTLKWIGLNDCIEEFSNLMLQQIDLRYEAKCLEKFNENFSDVSYIRFPTPIHPFCKRDALVETFEEGIQISKFIKNPDSSSIKKCLASYGMDALIQMIFIDNFLHGDLHPGNILVQNAKDFTTEDDNKLVLVDLCDTVIINVKPNENPLRLVFLDVGITTSLLQNELENFKNVFTAITIGEGEKVADLMMNHAQYHECTDITGFKKEIGAVINSAHQQTLHLESLHVAELLQKVFSITSHYKVKMETKFVSIMVAMFILEGLGRSLDPNLDLLEKARPVLLL